MPPMKDSEKQLMISAAQALLRKNNELVLNIQDYLDICINRQLKVVDSVTFLAEIENLHDLLGLISVQEKSLIYAYIRTGKIKPIVTIFHYLVIYANCHGFLTPADWWAFAECYEQFHLTFPIDERRNYADHDMAKQFNEIRRIFKKHLVES